MALKQLVDFSAVCSWAVLDRQFFPPSMYMCVDFFLLEAGFPTGVFP